MFSALMILEPFMILNMVSNISITNDFRYNLLLMQELFKTIIYLFIIVMHIFMKYISKKIIYLLME